VRYRLGRGRRRARRGRQGGGADGTRRRGGARERLDEASWYRPHPREPSLACRFLTASHPVPDARGLAAAAEVESLARGLGRDRPPARAPLRRGLRAPPFPAADVTPRGQGAHDGPPPPCGSDDPRDETPCEAPVAAQAAASRGRRLRHACDGSCSPTWSATTSHDRLRPDGAPIPPRSPTRSPSCGAGRSSTTSPRQCAPGSWPGPGEVAENPQARRARFRRVATRIVGSTPPEHPGGRPEARRHGLRPLVLTTRLEGEAREVARCWGRVADCRDGVEYVPPGPAAGLPPSRRRDDGHGPGADREDGTRRTGGRRRPQCLGLGFPGPGGRGQACHRRDRRASDAAGGIADERRSPGPPPRPRLRGRLPWRPATPATTWARWAISSSPARRDQRVSTRDPPRWPPLPRRGIIR